MYSSPDPAVKECDYIFSAKDKNAVLKVISLIQTTFKSQLTLSDTYFEPQSQMEKVFKLANINRHLLFNTDLDATGVPLPIQFPAFSNLLLNMLYLDSEA